jgi:hypothetical protein
MGIHSSKARGNGGSNPALSALPAVALYHIRFFNQHPEKPTAKPAIREYENYMVGLRAVPVKSLAGF